MLHAPSDTVVRVFFVSLFHFRQSAPTLPIPPPLPVPPNLQAPPVAPFLSSVSARLAESEAGFSLENRL
jgi:hypothetical protein